MSWTRKPDSVAAEVALDGLYIICTSVSVTQIDVSECVRGYKSRSSVERAFRSIKTIDLKVRPPIFLCMLAYCVQWHLREAWRELMFTDTEQQLKRTRDPVAPATRSDLVQTKAASRTLSHGILARSSRPRWPSLPPSCATPAARLMPGLKRRLSKSSPRPMQNSCAPLN